MSNTSRIAKNTLLLYFRQILIMLVSLYTVRIVLSVLGAEDYGIYNVTAGVVTMFGFLTSTMASASQRYLAVDLATGDLEKQKRTFGLILLSYILLMIVSVVLAESIALWFLNAKMTIPDGRINAANWVLQSAILSFVVNIWLTPYLSAVIAHEKMNIYAYVSILDAVLKLAVVYLLEVMDSDKLILYAVLLFASSVICAVIYILYCKKNFPECRAKLFYDKKQLVEMTSFAGWNMIGTVANLLRSQGINILLNLFFNPAVNAARAIAYQINGAITSFSNSFYTAIRPQIIKSYASGENERMKKLITSSSRLAFFLMLLLSLPIFLNIDFVLELWLKNPPEYTAIFVKLVLLNALIEVFSMPLVTGLQATGKIKKYQMMVSTVYLLNIPISYVLLRFDYPPETTMYINIGLVVVSFIPRLLICQNSYLLSITKYMTDVLTKTFVVTAICYSINLLVIRRMNVDNFAGLFISCIIILTTTGFVIFFVGLRKSERQLIVNKAKSILKR